MFVYVYTPPKLDKKTKQQYFFFCNCFAEHGTFIGLYQIQNKPILMTQVKYEVFCLGDEDQIQQNSTGNAAVYAAFSSTSRTSSYMH